MKRRTLQTSIVPLPAVVKACGAKMD